MTRPRPTIRAARFGDIPALHGLLVEAHQRSRLARYPFNDREAKAVLQNAIQRHGGVTAGAQFVAVAEADGQLEGFVLGLLQPLYAVLDALEATDVFWVVREGAHAVTGAKLLRAMHRWAEASPKLALIRHGATDVITDPRLTARLLARHGLTQRGVIFEREAT